jgi:hypothetical protein
MKKSIFILACALISFSGFSQKRVIISKEWQNYGVRMENSDKLNPEEQRSIPPLKSKCFLEEDIGTTWYDLQTMSSIQKRLHVFDDGSMAAVWTMGFDLIAFFDRGTGYNYFDGASWGPEPEGILESYRSGWPEYDQYGENGEIVVSHISGTGVAEGLTLLNRENKGTGTWTELNFLGPPQCEGLLWPRIATGGVDHSVIHLLAVTVPNGNCGPPYQDQDMAILYSRSLDGGNNWAPKNYIIPLINSNYYNGFSADVYDINAQGDNVGILIGGKWIGLLLLKSNDGGNTWAKTIIWDHPYPLFNYNYPTDTFYCADGSHAFDFDNNGMAHVVFGINRTYCDGAGTYWFPAVDGIGYWNENRPTFSNNLNALSPYGDPGSELEEDYSLIGWTQDINNNGQLDILNDWGMYYIGFSSMPQILVDDDNEIFVVYSSVTENLDNGEQNYRHIWARYSSQGLFWGSFIDLTNNPIHIFDECIYPSLAPYSDDFYYLTYQRDLEPGLAIRGDQDPFTENYITFMKTDFAVGIPEKQKSGEILKVSQNHPNPFSSESKIKVELFEAANVTLTIKTLTGQKVLQTDKGYLQPGVHLFSINAKGLNPGLYFYTVNAGEFSTTKKMIIE